MMLIPWLMVVLTAEPGQVLVVLNTPSEAGAREQISKATKAPLVDATAVYNTFYASSMLGFQDFGGFTDAPPRDWPPSLADAWASTFEYCRSIAGPPPWAGPQTMTSAMCCSKRAADFLWRAYVAKLAPTRVFVVQAHGGEHPTVEGFTFANEAAEQFEVSEAGDSAAVTTSVVKALLANQGTKVAREPSQPMFTAVANDPFSTEGMIARVSKTKKCDALPKSLIVTTAGALAKSVQERWAASVDSTGPGQTCTLSFSQHVEPQSMQTAIKFFDPVMTTLLTCGKVTVSAEIIKSTKLTAKQLDTVTDRLVYGLSDRWCRGTR